MDILYKPWPWYVAGPLLGLSVPVLLWLGNKRLGISSTMRHLCAMVAPARIPLFQYNWKAETWNLVFVAGILIGGALAGGVFANPEPVAVSEATRATLTGWGVSNQTGLVPPELFSWASLASLQGLLLMGAGGFLVGFGTRYAQGCTSGHGIFGLSTLQWPSLVATASFFAGGIVVSYFVLPFILSL
ncbi:MAG: YeeE/YedE family protein [Cyclobacteriaceae bacterium]|nr:YeeE/YedE family protein [Cyclobacteriaceae bacterium]